MKKIYHLATCSTCKRIISELNPDNAVELQDIKTNKITEEQLEEMVALSDSYESLFSRKAMKYKALGLNEKILSESDYKKLILEEYTFLKRPVIIIGQQIFIGNSSKVIDAARQVL